MSGDDGVRASVFGMDRWDDEPCSGREATREFYGDPDDPVEELGGYSKHGTPRDGDELCDGHQAHYKWERGRWT